MAGESLDGMTLNERLFVTGLLDAFDAAARRRDRATMRALLERADVRPDEAQRTVDTILADPARYGF